MFLLAAVLGNIQQEQVLHGEQHHGRSVLVTNG